MNVTENEIKRLLNEQVDAELGPRRPAPPFVAPSAAERAKSRWLGGNRAPWVLPLLAAACVAAVVGGTLGASNLLADDTTISPATVGPTPAPPAPTADSPTAPSPTPPKTSSSVVIHPNPHLVVLGGARIAVPNGWTATKIGESAAGGVWCLNPAGAKQYACAIDFRPLVQTAPVGPGIDVDVQGAGIGDPPMYCDADPLVHSEQSDERSFGGRLAEWRKWDGTCPADGSAFTVEQYVVASNPAYSLIAFPSDAGADVHAAMTEIADLSTLPPQTDPLRLMDRGIVRATERAADGVTITIDRVARTIDGSGDQITNNNPTTYTYLVPTRLYDDAQASVGDVVRLESDGVRVLTFVRETG